MVNIDLNNVTGFRKQLLDWFKNNRRDFPWRNSEDPYEILIAELMLRRTRADQVVPVYEEFLRRYPTPELLDNANEKDVADIVYSLGLEWRVPAFKQVVRELGSKYSYLVPSTREELVELPGVGDYVAGAILSVAYGKREWIVDTNVARVFKRYLGLETINEARRDKQIISLAKEYATSDRARDANLALLDFAALVCKARDPLCDSCVFAKDCKFRAGTISL